MPSETESPEPDADNADDAGGADDGEPAQKPALPAAGHDPTGLELARSVAGAYRGSSGGPRARRRRDPERTGRTVQPVSGAHPDDRDPQLVGTSLQRLVAEQGWSTDLAVHALFGRWDTIVGASVAEHCRHRSFTDPELLVAADSTAWATQMRLLAPTVLRRLNEELGHGTVTRVVVDGPKPPSWRRGRRSVRDGRGPRDTYG